MKKALIFFAVILTALITFSWQSSASFATEPEDKANGWWILHEYQDRILNNRCIGEFSFEVPVWSSIIIKVTGDSVYSWGSIFPRRSSVRLESDTLSILHGMHTNFPLVFSARKSELQLTFLNKDSVPQTYHYRRLKATEQLTLLKDLDDPAQRWTLDRNYQTFFQEQFFTGTFTDLNGKSFTINKKGGVKGFENWNSCTVDNFFGTTHWLGKRDRVRFEDNTDRTYQDYNWRYKGDTLILRKFIGSDIEQYTLSKEEERYIRSPLAN